MIRLLTGYGANSHIVLKHVESPVKKGTEAGELKRKLNTWRMLLISDDEYIPFMEELTKNIDTPILTMKAKYPFSKNDADFHIIPLEEKILFLNEKDSKTEATVKDYSNNMSLIVDTHKNDLWKNGKIVDNFETKLKSIISVLYSIASKEQVFKQPASKVDIAKALWSMRTAETQKRIKKPTEQKTC